MSKASRPPGRRAAAMFRKAASSAAGSSRWLSESKENGGVAGAGQVEARGIGQGELRRGRVGAGVGQHLPRNVEAGDAEAARGEQRRQIAGTAADIQNARLRRQAVEPDALQDWEGRGVKFLAPVAVVEPGEIVVAGHNPRTPFSMAY